MVEGEKKRNVYIALHWVYIKRFFDRENERKVYIGASSALNGSNFPMLKELERIVEAGMSTGYFYDCFDKLIMQKPCI